MKKILLNLSNLHLGGGVQVGVSFISELCSSNHDLKRFDIWISSEIYSNLRNDKVNLDKFSNYIIIDVFGIESIFSIKILYSILFKYSSVFTLFGPFYTIIKPKYSIVGFAQPSIINPNVAINLSSTYLNKLLLKLKISLQKYFFYKSDIILVESDNVRKSLLLFKKFNRKPIHVVNNSCSSIYKFPERWQDINYDFGSAKIKLGFLGRNYPHKNTKILPDVLNILRQKYKLDIDIFVTFNEREWLACPDYFKSTILNVGPLNITQCPKFYDHIDGLIFPSILECFSVTPLEALIMGKPIFLSDREFNRDIVNNYGIYFDPFNPEDIAYKIYNYFILESSFKESANHVRDYVLANFNAKVRMESYIKIISNQ